MEAALLYLFKANVVLALFAAAYYGLLRRLTFFHLNRAYLLFALGFAAAYPLLPMPALPATATGPLPLVLLAAGPALGAVAAPGASAPAAIDWWLLAGGLYAAGAVVLLLRLLVQLLSLRQMQRQAQATVVLGQPVRVVTGESGPFSFGSAIYLPAKTLADADALPATLRHEQAHVRQWHTLDVLAWQLATALAWLNPAAWLLRRAALNNLEFLADRAALLGSGLPRRTYQYLLLHQQMGGVPAPALAFQVDFLTLKHRISMLNQPLSSSRQLGRYLLAAPLVVALALGYSAAQAQVAPKPAPATKPMPADVAIYLDGNKVDKATLDKAAPGDMVEYVNVLKPEQAQQLFGTAAPTMVVTTKANANSPKVLAFNKRINDLVPMVPATNAQNEAIAMAKSYVNVHYPSAKVESVGIVTGQSDRYNATFSQNGKRVYLLFDGKGHVVAQ